MRKRWFERLAGPVVHGKRRLIRRFISAVPILAGLFIYLLQTGEECQTVYWCSTSQLSAE
jgi:hypothetical protein